MLTQTQLIKIKQHLESSQNPLFFFDNDTDGLCSFLILQRAIQRGKGVSIKSFPDLHENYIRKVEELNPDYIFILDKPRISKEFVAKVKEKNLPIIWLDHHDVQVEKEILNNVEYYNTFPSSEPVTLICYNIYKNSSEQWLAMLGCIGDAFMPPFAEEFTKQNPELFSLNLTAFDALYKTQIGKAVEILNAGLKDTTTNIVKMIKYLSKANNTYDILNQNPKNFQMHKRYNEINQVLQKQVSKAESENTNQRLMFFSYGGNISMSSEISNALYFKHRDKTIVVAYKRPDKINISIRGENAKQITEKAVADIKGATGGGHQQACGATIPPDMLEKFKKNIEKQIN